MYCKVVQERLAYLLCREIIQACITVIGDYGSVESQFGNEELSCEAKLLPKTGSFMTHGLDDGWFSVLAVRCLVASRKRHKYQSITSRKCFRSSIWMSVVFVSIAVCHSNC